MATYTCITCRVAFRDAEMQRAHYKTDWHRYNLRRKVADMAPVTAEGFQERVRAQRAVAEEESKGTATYCTVCSKKFATFNAYENHLKSRRHVELEKKAVQAVSRQVEMMNEKNLEKGLGVDSVNKDAMNAAIQQAIKAQPSTSPKKAPCVPADESRRAAGAARRGAPERDPAEKPPRLQWFEQQAKKLAKQHWEESGEDGEEEEDDEGKRPCRGWGDGERLPVPGDTPIEMESWVHFQRCRRPRGLNSRPRTSGKHSTEASPSRLHVYVGNRMSPFQAGLDFLIPLLQPWRELGSRSRASCLDLCLLTSLKLLLYVC